MWAREDGKDEKEEEKRAGSWERAVYLYSFLS